MDPQLVNICYLVAAVLFILDLKWMAHPRTAVRGNRAGAIAMAIAVIATLLSNEFQLGAGWIAAGIAIGTIIGLFAALKVKMTTMPELVGLFNGFGGAASILVAGAALVAAMAAIELPDMQTKVATAASALIGSITFFGSYVAFGKLAEFLGVKWKLYPWQSAIKFGFSGIVVAGAAYLGTYEVTLAGALAVAGVSGEALWQIPVATHALRWGFHLCLLPAVVLWRPRPLKASLPLMAAAEARLLLELARGLFRGNARFHG